MSANGNKVEHILNASSSLLGFSFIAVTTLRALKLIHTTHVDQFASLGVVIFTISVLFSFLSIRSNKMRAKKTYETIAEYVFLFGLLNILVLIALIEIKLV